MITNFTVKASREKNDLLIAMDGFFMKSEVELVLHLAKKECKKLIPGFSMSFDIQHFNTSNRKTQFKIETWVSNLAKSMGPKISGTLTEMNSYDTIHLLLSVFTHMKMSGFCNKLRAYADIFLLIPVVNLYNTILVRLFEIKKSHIGCFMVNI